MPVSGKKKPSTLNTPDSTQGQSAPTLPEQDEFRQHLRELARGAIRTMLEDVMREELDALIGAGWGRAAPHAKAIATAPTPVSLLTTSGRLEDLQVPRDREGQFRTQVFERYRGSEPQVAQGLTEMFVAGASTHKAGEVAQTLLGVAPSGSRHQSAQSRSRAAVHRLAGALPASRLPHPLSRWHPVQRASRRAGRFDHDPDSSGSGHGWKQRGVGAARLC
jgi:hypothetical protein